MEQDESGQTRGWNGYFDWAAELGGANASDRAPSQRLAAQGIDPEDGGPILWEPIFVRSSDRNIGTDEFFADLNTDASKERTIVFDPFEQDYNKLLRREGDPVEAMLLRRRDRQREENLFQVMTTGGLQTEQGLTGARLSKSLKVSAVRSDHRVALGIIDDGIPVLHGRFRRTPTTTRLVAFWAQVISTQGSVESKADLDQELSRLARMSEDELYRERADAIYPPSTRHSLRQRGTHGSHMLDLAGSSDPVAPNALADVPLLAVQLPPQVFDDTSGMRLVPYLVSALRWQIYQTVAHNIASSLVVNVSLGVVAGPKDGTSFLEQLIAREIDRAATNPHRPLNVEVVLPYGNAYRDRLVGRRKLAPGEDSEFRVRLLPDDRTPSYVEFRLTRFGAERNPANLEVGLVGPHGSPTILPLSIPAGQHLPIHDAKGRLIARLYHVPDRQLWTDDEPAYLVLAFAPTIRVFDADLTCPSGLWTISVRNAGAAPMDCVVQAQRDDSPFPRRTGARQAYLDSDGDEVTHQGTNSAYTTVKSPGVHTVGGALVRGASIEPAEYTAEGADWSGDAPKLSAISEAARAPRGLRAAGMLSAATIRLSGSSTSAATVSRQLVLGTLGVPTLTTAAMPAPPSRLGSEVVTDNLAIRG